MSSIPLPVHSRLANPPHLAMPMSLAPLALLLAALPQATAPTAAELMNRLDAKRTGAASVALPPAVTFQGTIEIRRTGQPDAPPLSGTFTFYCDGGKTLQSVQYAQIGKAERGHDGAVTWETNPVGPPRIFRGAQAETVRRNQAFGPWPGWRALYAKLEDPQKREIDGRPHDVIRAVSPLGKVDSYWLDPETGLPTQIEIEAVGPDGPVPTTLRYSQWKAVDGVLYAHAVKTLAPGIESTVKLEKVVHGAVPAEKFVSPAAIQELASAAQSRPDSSPASQPAAAPKIVELTAQPFASIRMKAKPSEIAQKLAEALPEVARFLAANEAASGNPGFPFTRYHSYSADELDIEAGIAVEKPIAPTGRILAGELPAGRAAVAIHLGKYDDLASTHLVLSRWVAEQGLEADGPAWEVYVTDPGLEPDPAKWRTDVYLPLKPAVKK